MPQKGDLNQNGLPCSRSLKFYIKLPFMKHKKGRSVVVQTIFIDAFACATLIGQEQENLDCSKSKSSEATPKPLLYIFCLLMF